VCCSQNYSNFSLYLATSRHTHQFFSSFTLASVTLLLLKIVFFTKPWMCKNKKLMVKLKFHQNRCIFEFWPEFFSIYNVHPVSCMSSGLLTEHEVFALNFTNFTIFPLQAANLKTILYAKMHFHKLITYLTLHSWIWSSTMGA